MRVFYFSISVFSLFLLAPTSIILSQKITQEKGLTTAVFNVSQGTVKIYLPDDIRQGDAISGTVTTTPEGRNEKQLQKNIAELSRYAIVLNGQKFVLDQGSRSTRFTVPAVNSAQNSVALFFDNAATPVQQLNIPAKPVSEQRPAPVQCIIPGHVLAGSPMTIPGPFDGNAANTQCTTNNQPATILAESPRSCIVAFPENANGMQATEVIENGQQPCTKNVSAVQMNVAAGKLNLQKGESTYIDVSITGLQGLPDTALLSLVNLTPDIVLLQPSNTIVVPLVPGAVSSGNFNRRFDVQSIKTGTFMVNCKLDLPGIMLSPGPGENNEDKGDDKCNCTAKAAIVVMKVENDMTTYMATPLAGCSGEKCAYKNDIKFTWQIAGGAGNGEIISTADNGFTIKVKRKNAGNYSIKNTVTVTCSDGTTCTDNIFFNDKGEEVPGTVSGEKPGEYKIPVTPDTAKGPPIKDTTTLGKKACIRDISEGLLPQMDGGLKRGLLTRSTIKRDDFIALVAEGADYDIVKITCTKTGECLESSSEISVPLSSKIRFQWSIQNKQGQFVKLGCLNPAGESDQLAKGEQVIFMPPYVPLPVHPKKEISITSIIKLSIIDDVRGGRLDTQVDKIYEIIVLRNSDNPDQYEIEIKMQIGQKAQILPLAPPPPKTPPVCKAQHGGWVKDTEFKIPKIILPNVPDNNKMVLGQWIVLEAEDQHDNDLLTDIGCDSPNCGSAPPISKIYEDNVQWSWEVNGKAIGKEGRYIVYQLPDKMDEGKTEMELSIRVKVYNPDGLQATDPELWSEPVTIKFYQPGVKLSTAYDTWVPTYNVKEGVTITSTLMIKDGEDWKPAPAHTCRIHYFDLFGVSNERGFCMNSPLPAKANSCRDLKIKNEKKHEAYDNVKQAGCLDNTGYFMQARTQKPEYSYPITIYSEDFGSWGFLRSFANVNEESKVKGEQKKGNPYVKIPGMTTDQLEAIDKGLAEYNAHLTAYYALKDQKIKQQLPYYTPIPITSSDLKHPIKPEKAKYDYTDNRVSIPLDLDSNHIPDNGWIYLTVEDKAAGITTNSMVSDSPVDNDIDMDNEPKGDGVGDGLSWYEEYRGFMVARPELKHQRTFPNTKDLFVDNKDGLPIEAFVAATGITVHQISESQHSPIIGVNDKTIKDWGFTNRRFINFNYGLGHEIHQKGLYLRNEIIVNDVVGEEILGLTPSEKDLKQKKVYPAPPNWNLAVRIDRAKISRFYIGAAFDAKLAQIVAHELCHSVNVAHHGEKGQDPGLFSGDINCIMRYEGLNQAPGTTLCTQQAGAHKGRGSCALQIRVSGRVDPANITRGYPQKD